MLPVLEGQGFDPPVAKPANREDAPSITLTAIFTKYKWRLGLWLVEDGTAAEEISVRANNIVTVEKADEAKGYFDRKYYFPERKRAGEPSPRTEISVYPPITLKGDGIAMHTIFVKQTPAQVRQRIADAKKAAAPKP
jgi:hypothetical protein